MQREHRMRDIAVEYMKRFNPDLRSSGFKKALRESLLISGEFGDQESAEEDLPEGEQSYWWVDDILSQVVIVPHAYSIHIGKQLVTAYEIEDRARLSVDRIRRYADLWWFLDSYNWELELRPTDQYGNASPALDLFRWEGAIIALNAKRNERAEKPKHRTPTHKESLSVEKGAT